MLRGEEVGVAEGKVGVAEGEGGGRGQDFAHDFILHLPS